MEHIDTLVRQLNRQVSTLEHLALFEEGLENTRNIGKTRFLYKNFINKCNHIQNHRILMMKRNHKYVEGSFNLKLAIYKELNSKRLAYRRFLN
jgi:hypothetical protein